MEGGSSGPPRLLIPVILALGYNRYNLLYAEQLGVALKLIPMLVGFFTYKFAVVGRQGLQLMNDVTSEISGSKEAGQGGSKADEEDGGSMTLDRIFIKRVNGL